MTDNTQVVSALNKGTSVNANTTSLLRDIFWICVMYNIYLFARHIPGVDNVIPDMLFFFFFFFIEKNHIRVSPDLPVIYSTGL